MTHTPGPWTTEDRCNGGYVRESQPWDDTGGIKRRKAVAQVRVANRTPEENEANAHLIAAAPDLLAALEAFADLLGYEDSIGADDKVTVISGPTTDYSIKGSNILAARAAITKARNTPALHIEVL